MRSLLQTVTSLLRHMRPHLAGDTVLLLMGARDPSLEAFAAHIWRDL
jgi:UDP-N-acetylmuramate--alanine ligase